MSGPSPIISEETAASTPEVIVTPDDAAIVPVTVPHVPIGNIYTVRAEKGQRDTVVTRYDLDRADVSGDAVLPTWSDPNLVVATYGLRQLVQICEELVRETFGNTASVTLGIEQDADSLAPSLVFTLSVPRSARHLRHDFVAEYARRVLIPEKAPVPVLVWEYQDAVPA